MEIDIKKLAKLSRLKIEENQIAGFEKDMAGIHRNGRKSA